MFQSRLEELKETHLNCRRSVGPAGFSVRAVAAQAEDLETVLNIAETVIRGDLSRPGFHSWSLDLYRTTAAPANEVVMVAGGAAAVSRLTVVSSDGIQLVGAGHQLEGPVDRGEADARAGVTQVVVDLPCRAELVCPAEHFFHGGALAGFSLGDGHRPLRPPPAVTSSG
jgi:hypothetical protein